MPKAVIRIRGLLSQEWTESFEGGQITPFGADETLLEVEVQDQAALYGVIARLRDLGLKLISVSVEESKE